MRTRTVHEQIKKLIPEARISEGAAKEIAEYLVESCNQIALKAWDFAIHAKRQTITIEDVKLVIKQGTRS